MSTNQIRTTRSRRTIGSLLGAAVVAGTLAAAVPATTAQATAPLKWAVSDGSSMTRSSGTTGFTKLGTGRYEVNFGDDVRSCAYLASTHVSGSQAQTVFTAGGHVNGTTGVYVETKNQGGGLSDAPFSLFLACGNTTTERRAVVDYDGALQRGSNGTVVTSLGTGRYQVKLNRSVAECTPIATVGDPANGLVFNPGHVSTSRVAGKPATVYVETKNLAGGLTAGIPFHLATICGGADVVRASVNADGTPAAASALTSSFRSSTGAYTIATKRNLGQCAWLTTRSEHGTGVPFTPTTVEATAGPAANTVNISEKVQLQLGGAPASESFGFVAVC